MLSNLLTPCVLVEAFFYFYLHSFKHFLHIPWTLLTSRFVYLTSFLNESQGHSQKLVGRGGFGYFFLNTFWIFYWCQIFSLCKLPSRRRFRTPWKPLPDSVHAQNICRWMNRNEKKDINNIIIIKTFFKVSFLFSYMSISSSSSSSTLTSLKCR